MSIFGRKRRFPMGPMDPETRKALRESPWFPPRIRAGGETFFESLSDYPILGNELVKTLSSEELVEYQQFLACMFGTKEEGT